MQIKTDPVLWKHHVLRALQVASHLILTKTWWVRGSNTPISHRGRLRPKEKKRVAKGHTSGSSWSRPQSVRAKAAAFSLREPVSLYCLAPAKVQFTEYPREKSTRTTREMGLLRSNPELEPGEGRKAPQVFKAPALKIAREMTAKHEVSSEKKKLSCNWMSLLCCPWEKHVKLWEAEHWQLFSANPPLHSTPSPHRGGCRHLYGTH